MEGVAWLLAEEVFDGNAWPGFFVEAAVFLLIAAAAGFFAYRSVQAGAPPVPEQAIEEAKLTKATLESGAKRAANERPARARPPTDRRHARPLPGGDPPDIDLQRRDLGTLGRAAPRPGRRADRLAPPGARAPLPADRRRGRRRLRPRRPDDAAPPPLSAPAVADLAEIRQMIEAALPGAEVEVVDETGTGDHLRATVTAPQFEGLSRVDQHRLVKAAVKSASTTARSTPSP